MNEARRTLRLFYEVLAISYPGWGELKGHSKLMCFRPEKGNRYDKIPTSFSTSLLSHLPTCFQPRKNLSLPRNVLAKCIVFLDLESLFISSAVTKTHCEDAI